MGTIVNHEDLCFVHQAPGGDYHAAFADRQEASVGDSIRGFLANLPRTVSRIRVLGLPAHAEFMLACHKRCPEIRLEVGSPQACPFVDELADPRVAIQRMRQHVLSPSLGGFHRFTEVDRWIYTLCHLAYIDQGPSPRVMAAASRHPAWYDLHFIPTLDPWTAAALLASIVDYRWYIDRRHPDRVARLESALGMIPAVQGPISRGAEPTTRKQRLCLQVRNVWNGDGDIHLGAPGNFLRRISNTHGGGPKGELAAGRAFVSYLVRTWEQELARRTMPHMREPLFLPEQLLRREPIDEVAAYRVFAARRPPLPA